MTPAHRLTSLFTNGKWFARVWPGNVMIWCYVKVDVNTVTVHCLLILMQPTHTNFTMQLEINSQTHTHTHTHTELHDRLINPVSSFFFFKLFFAYCHQASHSIPPPSTIFISFFLLHPGANEFWTVWGPKPLPYRSLSSWVLPWCAKCLSWILNKPQDHLRASWSTALLLPSYYSARGLGAPSGWMSFESVVLWAKLKIIGTGGLSVWSRVIRSHVIIQPFLSLFLLAEVASKLLSKVCYFMVYPVEVWNR